MFFACFSSELYIISYVMCDLKWQILNWLKQKRNDLAPITKNREVEPQA